MDFRFQAGAIPLLVSMPHVGTAIPDDIAATMAPSALIRADTDWHLDRLYAFAADLGASTLAAHWSRYVIDLNRSADDTNLYPGLDTTSLCPVDTFGRERLYQAGRGLSEAEVQRRLLRYWQPYHRQLRAELARLRALHGHVLLWDAHSIASVVPRLFDGRLPDLNIGTADGTSCAAGLEHAVVAAAQDQRQFTVAVNDRFKGGYITREYGQPDQHVHALQLEMCQCLYMDETAPFAYRPDRAARVLPVVRNCVEAALAWVRR